MRSVPYSLYLSIGEFESKLTLKLIYNIDLFNEEVALSILHSLKTKLLSPTVFKCGELASGLFSQALTIALLVSCSINNDSHHQVVRSIKIFSDERCLKIRRCYFGSNTFIANSLIV